MDQKYKTFNIMNKNAGMDSRRATNVNDNYSDKYNNKHTQAVADRQAPIDGVDVEGGIVTPFNIYKPENPIKTRIVVDSRRLVLDKKTQDELKTIQARRSGVMSFNMRESHQ